MTPGSQAEAGNPEPTWLRLRLSSGGRELGSISAGTAGTTSPNLSFEQRLGAAGIAASNL